MSRSNLIAVLAFVGICGGGWLNLIMNVHNKPQVVEIGSEQTSEFSQWQEQHAVIPAVEHPNHYCNFSKDCQEAVWRARDFDVRREAAYKARKHLLEKECQLSNPRTVKMYSKKNHWIYTELFHVDAAKIPCSVPFSLTTSSAEPVDVHIWQWDRENNVNSTMDAIFLYEPFEFDKSLDRITVGCHQDDDIYASYWPAEYGTDCNLDNSCLFFPDFVDQEYARELREQRTSLGALFISNCQYARKRMNLLRDLATVIPLDSYGGCTPNGTTHVSDANIDWKRLVPGVAKPSLYQEKIAIMSTYRFSFTLENSIYEDYITEKLFHGLQAGNPLVVFGAPNVDDYAPRKNSWINALHYRNGKELGEYILKVNQSESLYQEYMRYKFSAEPLNPAFQLMYDESLKVQIGGANSAFCKIAEMYVQLQGCQLPSLN
jgi:hypothetical protein